MNMLKLRQEDVRKKLWVNGTAAGARASVALCSAYERSGDGT